MSVLCPNPSIPRGSTYQLNARSTPESSVRSFWPELARRKPGTLRQRFELCARDLRMHAPAEAAVGTGDHVLTSDHVRVGDEARGQSR